LGNFGRTKLVLGTEATGGALSFTQELRKNEEKHLEKSNLGRTSSCPGENGMHTENWAERIPSVLGKTVRGNKSNEASEKIQTWPIDEEHERKRNRARRKSRQASAGNSTEKNPCRRNLSRGINSTGPQI
jgi:hypothetical protein